MTDLSTRAESAAPDEARGLLEELIDALDVSDGWDKARWYAWFQLTESIDTPEAHLAAAMMLVPEGWKIAHLCQTDSSKPAQQWFAELRHRHVTSYDKVAMGYAATPALALIAAIARSVE